MTQKALKKELARLRKQDHQEYQNCTIDDIELFDEQTAKLNLVKKQDVVDVYINWFTSYEDQRYVCVCACLHVCVCVCVCVYVCACMFV